MQRSPGTSRIGRFNAWFFDTFDGLIDWSARMSETNPENREGHIASKPSSEKDYLPSLRETVEPLVYPFVHRSTHHGWHRPARSRARSRRFPQVKYRV